MFIRLPTFSFILVFFLFLYSSFLSLASLSFSLSPSPSLSHSLLYLLVSLVCVKLSIELLKPMISKARSFNHTGSAKCKRSETYISLGILNSGCPLNKSEANGVRSYRMEEIVSSTLGSREPSPPYGLDDHVADVCRLQHGEDQAKWPIGAVDSVKHPSIDKIRTH